MLLAVLVLLHTINPNNPLAPIATVLALPAIEAVITGRTGIHLLNTVLLNMLAVGRGLTRGMDQDAEIIPASLEARTELFFSIHLSLIAVGKALTKGVDQDPETLTVSLKAPTGPTLIPVLIAPGNVSSDQIRLQSIGIKNDLASGGPNVLEQLQVSRSFTMVSTASSSHGNDQNLITASLLAPASHRPCVMMTRRYGYLLACKMLELEN